MKVNTKEPEWFQRWFNEDYAELYSHRDLKQACNQVQVCVSHANIKKRDLILDLACGSGRHLAAWRSLGYRAIGVDLSHVLLGQSKKAGHKVAQVDMRHLPFGSGVFSLVTSFFSSYGYFKTAEEDAQVLRGVYNILLPSGWFYLDLANKVPIVNGLIPRDEKILDNGRVIQQRKMQGSVVVKRIELIKAHHTPRLFEERLRLYTLEEIKAACISHGFTIHSVLGDEAGNVYESELSPRMSLLLRKPA